MSSRPTPPEEYLSENDRQDSHLPAPAPGAKTKRLLIDLLGRWYWVVLGMILGGLNASYYLSKAPNRYSATATLLIKQNTQTVISKDQVDEIDMRSTEGLNTVAERIRRHDLLERVSSRVDVRSLPGLIPPQVDWTPAWASDWLNRYRGKSADEGHSTSQPAPAPAALAGYLGSWMNISIRRGTRLLDITFEHEVPEVAKALADAVAREYLVEIAGAITEGRSNQSDTLLKQSEEARAKIQATESAKASYIRALGVHQSLEAQEKATQQLGRRYLAKHPKMIAAMGELKELQAKFLEEFAIARSSPADAAYWKTNGEQLEAVKDDQEAHLRLARQLLLSRTSVLQGETQSQMSVFNAMLTRLEESNVNAQRESSSAEMSSFARVPGWPSAPNPSRILRNGLGGGFALGLLLAFGLVRLDNKFHSVAQLEAEAGLPVLAAISNIDLHHLDQAVKSVLKRGKLAELNPKQEEWDPRLVFRPGTSSTNFAEMFRILRASVSLLGDEAARKVTLFSSALPGEGKSTVSSNFALAGAGQGRKTLLIDLDLRKPSLHTEFGIARDDLKLGITEWLAGQASLEEVTVDDVGAENLHVIFCGKRAPNPGELLNISKLKQLLEEAAANYDLVVLDSAPLLAVPDTRIIAPLVDNFCLVVRADYVPKGAAFRALELLSSAGSTPSGLVFNGFKETRRLIGQNYSYGSYRMSRYGSPYRYGYGSHGSYGSYGSDETDDDKRLARRKNRKRRS